MISTYDWFIARCKAVINHSRLHEAGHAVAGHRFGYVQQGIMLREDDTGETASSTPPVWTMTCPSDCRRR